MRKTKVKIPAKLNLTLDVVGFENGFHNLESLCAIVKNYTEITLVKRKDDKTVLKKCRPLINCEKPAVVKACELMLEKFGKIYKGIKGVDIYVKSNIPSSSGLGGSSADIAGALSAYKKLYGIKEDITDTANLLGSDVALLLGKTHGVMYGKGDMVKPVKLNKLRFIVLTDSVGISAKDCYACYDEMKVSVESVTAKVLKKIEKGEEYLGLLKNDLSSSAFKILPRLEEKIEDLKKSGAKTALLTGSGSAVYGIFEKNDIDRAYRVLKKKYKGHIIKTETV